MMPTACLLLLVSAAAVDVPVRVIVLRQPDLSADDTAPFWDTNSGTLALNASGDVTIAGHEPHTLATALGESDVTEIFQQVKEFYGDANVTWKPETILVPPSVPCSDGVTTRICGETPPGHNTIHHEAQATAVLPASPPSPAQAQLPKHVVFHTRHSSLRPVLVHVVLPPPLPSPSPLPLPFPSPAQASINVDRTTTLSSILAPSTKRYPKMAGKSAGPTSSLLCHVTSLCPVNTTCSSPSILASNRRASSSVANLPCLTAKQSPSQMSESGPTSSPRAPYDGPTP